MSADLRPPAYFSRQIAEAERFHRGPPAGSRGRLAVISGGRERCAADYVIRRRGFPCFGLELVAAGRGTLRLKGRAHRLMPGMVFSYGPGVPHEITSDPRQPLIKYFVDFAGARAAGLLRSVPLPPGTALQTAQPGELLGIFDQLIAAGGRATAAGGTVAALYLEILLRRLAETAIPPGAADTPAFQTFQRCRRALEENAGSLTTLAAAARFCHIDPAYLCRLFRRFEHTSPYQFLLRLRMRRAAALLHTRGVLVKQAAAEMGFDDPYHFSRAFKRVFGVSPAHFAASAQRRGEAGSAAAP